VASAGRLRHIRGGRRQGSGRIGQQLGLGDLAASVAPREQSRYSCAKFIPGFGSSSLDHRRSSGHGKGRQGIRQHLITIPVIKVLTGITDGTAFRLTITAQGHS
jgi:hypothetical protein